MSSEDALLPGFLSQMTALGEVALHARIGGSGPAIVLLHGYPQTHLCWHRVASELARSFSVVLPDLRGYGRSSAPASDSAHRTYSKRTMAQDVVRLMAELGHQRFAVIGHDRGGRVAYRLALERPDVVERLVVIDIITTSDHWRLEQQAQRRRAEHWAFLAQPAPLPEALIGNDVDAWLESRLKRGTQSRSLEPFHASAIKAYRALLADPDRRHASCEDHRAGATCDRADDEADMRTRRRIVAPTLLVWGRSGSISDLADPAEPWRAWAERLEERAIDGGHYLPEESPGELLAAMLPFLSQSEVPHDEQR